MRARAELAPGVVVHRTVVVVDDYLVDRVEWESDDQHELALPLHGVLLRSADGSPLVGTPAEIDGGDAREDGFAFLADTMQLMPIAAPARLMSSAVERRTGELDGWIATSGRATWWSAVAPGAPGRAAQPLVLVRCMARRGAITGVWSWRGSVHSADIGPDVVTVTRADGSVQVHRQGINMWMVESTSRGAHGISLGAGAATPSARAPSASSAPPDSAEPTGQGRSIAPPFSRTLGAEHYRRSEQSWDEAGRPTAVVSVERSDDRLVVRVDVPRAERHFVAIDAENPFDNDPFAIHGDGVQLYVVAGEQVAGWLLVPITDSNLVARRTAEGWSDALPLDAVWQPLAHGYSLVATITLPRHVATVDLDVVVNESAPGRTRRRGQLVLSGARDEFVYLRADRHERERLLRVAFSGS